MPKNMESVISSFPFFFFIPNRYVIQWRKILRKNVSRQSRRSCFVFQIQRKLNGHGLRARQCNRHPSFLFNHFPRTLIRQKNQFFQKLIFFFLLRYFLWSKKVSIFSYSVDSVHTQSDRLDSNFYFFFKCIPTCRSVWYNNFFFVRLMFDFFIYFFFNVFEIFNYQSGKYFNCNSFSANSVLEDYSQLRITISIFHMVFS